MKINPLLLALLNAKLISNARFLAAMFSTQAYSDAGGPHRRG